MGGGGGGVKATETTRIGSGFPSAFARSCLIGPIYLSPWDAGF